ncbi:hypothetical protein F8M41_014293 [Gigaspora margarita]|uniref:Uncharacterized protein n=1 Tax=Gigaspora margarita TaxID=4874 RepID=A0A8H4ENP5_GIGMA|nr:hypothetical protein F8M41_014293 [Gigaspora margarita]
MQLFVLGFFSEVVLTSPLVVRQGKLPSCPVNTLLTACHVVTEPSKQIMNVPPRYECGTSVTCNYYGSNANCNNIFVGCITSAVQVTRFYCSSGTVKPDGTEDQCGFTCNNCLATGENMSCSVCYGGIDAS